MIAFTQARMHLGVEIGGAGLHPAAADRAGADPRALAGFRHHLAMVMAARRGLDFVALPGAPGAAALDLATRMAPVVGGIDLLPAARPTGDPTPALAAFDAASTGRVGWQPTPRPDEWGAVAEVLESVADRWSAAEGTDAPLRSVDDPAPRHAVPLTVLRLDDSASLPAIGRWADVVRVAAPGLDAAHAARERVREAVAGAGRDPDDVPVLLDVEVHLAADRHRAHTDLAGLDAVAPTAAASVRVVGPASDLADLVGAALRLGAADGITVQPLVLPDDLRRVVD
jgi:alkanesulfonate monooxygenase SsuD/methylene tetrahydromethanopterin reductase-like flavin-dependent oxidoreductase (luciferase family)